MSILFDTAISSAYQDGFPHHAALASERAGLYFVEVDDEALASKYLSRSLILYGEWGATAKVKQLESEYGKYLDTDPSQIRTLKKTNAIPAGSLMFTDRKPDQFSQRTSRTNTYRSRSQDVERTRVNSRRSSSNDSRQKVLSKAAKEGNGQRSKSVAQKRPSLVRIRSWASMTSMISNVSEDKSDSRRGTRKNTGDRDKSDKGKFQKFARRNSISSIPSQANKRDSSDDSDKKKKGEKPKFQKFRRRNSTSSISTMEMQNVPAPMTAKEEKGKLQKFKRRNSISSIPTMEPVAESTSRDNSEKFPRRKNFEEADDIHLTPPLPQKKKAFSGPIPSPGPRKAKLILANDDLEGRSYLLDYDTDDFNTVNGDETLNDGDDSIISFNSDKESDESGVETKTKKKTKKKTKTTTKKKKKEPAIEEPDVLKTPKRRTKPKATVKSKTISL